MELAFIYGIIVFTFGLCIGSFINVIVYRINNNGSPLKGRSFCPKCKHQLAWLDNIPLLSFIFLKAKCRYCHSPISWQYPIVELATAVLSLIVFLNFYGFESYPFIIHYSLFIIHLILLYCLITVFVSDFLYYTVPTEPIIIALLAGVGIIYFGQLNLVTHIYCAVGAGLFFEILHLATKKRGMGFGDVEIAVLIGLLLGWPGTLSSIMLAFLTGAGVGVILILTGQKKMQSRIAFGPFLVFWLWMALNFKNIAELATNFFYR